MEVTERAKTIAQVFEEFLDDQKARLSPKTLAKYGDIIGLFESYLESYWPGHDQEEYKRITGAGGTFCGTFGPAEMLGGYSEFLGYFMSRKVMCGNETRKAAGTVTKKLAKWLIVKGYVQDAEGADERAAQATRDLPAAQQVLDMLDAYIDEHQPATYKNEIEDHFWIERVEPGKLWLEPLLAPGGVIGPISVPIPVSQRCRPMWDIGGVVAKTRQGWRFVEVWNVTP